MAAFRIITGRSKLPWTRRMLRRNLECLLQDLKEGLQVSETALAQSLESPLSELFFALDRKNRLVGYAELHEWRSATGRAGYIENVVVAKELQGHGIGKALGAALLRGARRRKLQSVHLHSGTWRAAAQAMYKSLGFNPKETVVLIKDF